MYPTGYLKHKQTNKHATELKGKKISRATQPSIKIDGGLSIELEEWLKTENAASLGFHSKSGFATEAIRKYMQSIRGPRFTDLRENGQGDYTMVDTYLNLPSKFLVVLVDKRHKILTCDYCKRTNCDHILYIWLSISSSTRLADIGFKCDSVGERFTLPV